MSRLLRVTLVGFAACLASSVAAGLSDADIKRKIEESRAFEKNVTRTPPPELLAHFATRGIVLREHPAGGGRVRWVAEYPGARADCLVYAVFVVFARGISRSDASAYMERFNAAAVLNDRAMIAMFYPGGEGEACSRDRQAFEVASKKLVATFQDYAPR